MSVGDAGIHLISSVPSLASLGIYTSDGRRQGDVRKGMPSETVRRKHGLMVLTTEARECPNTHVQAECLMDEE